MVSANMLECFLSLQMRHKLPASGLPSRVSWRCSRVCWRVPNQYQSIMDAGGYSGACLKEGVALRVGWRWRRVCGAFSTCFRRGYTWGTRTDVFWGIGLSARCFYECGPSPIEPALSVGKWIFDTVHILAVLAGSYYVGL